MKAPEGWEDIKYMLGEDPDVKWPSLAEAIADCKECVGGDLGDDSETIYRVKLMPVRRVLKRNGKVTVENIEKGGQKMNAIIAMHALIDGDKVRRPLWAKGAYLFWRKGRLFQRYAGSGEEEAQEEIEEVNDWEIVVEDAPPEPAHPDVLCVTCGARLRATCTPTLYYCDACHLLHVTGPPADEESVWGAKLLTQDNKSAFAHTFAPAWPTCEYPPGIWRRVDGKGCYVAVGGADYNDVGLCAGGYGHQLKVAFMECRTKLDSGGQHYECYRWVRQSSEPHPELLSDEFKQWVQKHGELLSDEQRRTLLGEPEPEPELDYIDVPVEEDPNPGLAFRIPYALPGAGKGWCYRVSSWLNFWPHAMGLVFEAPDGRRRLAMPWVFADVGGGWHFAGIPCADAVTYQQAELVAVRFHKEKK